MMLLTAGVMATFYRYYARGPDALGWKHATLMGTLLAWLYLARPNIGGVFIAYFGVLILLRGWKLRREVGLVEALKVLARREGIVVLLIGLWVLPFVIHSMSEWGEPTFSANAIYQRPLGTRFTMLTDTWWKYSEPGHMPTLGTLLHETPDQLRLKFTTSWISTLKTGLRPWALEILLAVTVVVWLARRAKSEPSTDVPPESARDLAVRRLGRTVFVVVLVNFLVLPMYGYQNYGYRHYLSFFLPFAWMTSGRAVVLFIDTVRPTASRLVAKVRENPGPWLFAIVAALLLWNLGTKSQDTNLMFVKAENFVGKHWLSFLLLLVFMVAHRWVLRRSRYLLTVLVLLSIVIFRYQPNREVKRFNLNWFAADARVYDALREAKGLVMSFAMQGEVNWASDRKNIPAPENILHAYSLLFDHKLEVEDVYIESAETMIGPFDGPFYYAAPGFESFARMEIYQGRLPGYEIVFHHATKKAYPKYRVTKPRPKASTVYRLKDRAAVLAMGNSPDRIELGNVSDVVYTTHGWSDYFNIEGKPVLAATNTTRERYLDLDAQDRPWEDTSTSFFLDDRRPTSVEFEIYATHPTTLQFYWNLDLYKYDAAKDRSAHQIGTYEVKTAGWQTIIVQVPASVTRRGLNKLGFRASSFAPVTVCPPSIQLTTCSQMIAPGPSGTFDATAIAFQDAKLTAPSLMRASVFAHALVFRYGTATK